MKFIGKILIVLMLIVFGISCSNTILDDQQQPEVSSGAQDTSVLRNYTSDQLASSESGEVREGYILIRENVPLKITYLRIEGINVYQGDMLLADKDIFNSEAEALKARYSDSRAIVMSDKLWPNNTVNYYISPNVHSRHVITSAIAAIEAATDITFVASQSGNYINFIPHASSCYSYVGMTGWGSQDLALANWATTGVAVHEIMHALGVKHEQSRVDRDNYMIINWSNIKAGMENNFQKASGPYAHDVGTMDWNSIMLYSSTAFSKNGLPTITKKDGSTYTTNRDAMSAGDKAGLNFLYKGSVNPGDVEAPTSPTALTASSVTASSVVLSWNRSTDNVGVTSYKVFKNGYLEKTVTTNSATISGLSASTAYSFTVAAVDAAGNVSIKSAAVSVTTSGSGGTGTNEWKVNTTYAAGDIVTYNGVTYKCITGHTAYSGWTPAAVPALWRKI